MPDQLTAPLGAEQPPRSSAADAQAVEVVDTTTTRVHHPSDLLQLVLSALGVAAVMLLAVYAHATTTGVAEDVRGVGAIVRQIFTVPVALLEVLVTFIAPAAVLVELAIRRVGRQVLDAVLAAVVGLLLCAVVAGTVTAVGSDQLVAALSARVRGQMSLTIPAYLVAVVGLLTAAGPRARRRTVAWSWNLVWVTVGVVLITGASSLPGAGIALLLGRIAGLGVRYVSGVRSERAYGVALVEGVRRAGFEPIRLRRVHQATAAGPPVTVGPPGTSVDVEPARTAPTPAAQALTRISDDRVYDLTCADGQRLTVVVLDGDRQVVGALSRLWRSIRLRGVEGRSFVSLRQAAERAALLAYAAHAAGVRTPALLSVAEADDSMLLVQERIERAVPLRDIDPGWLTDAHLRAIWHQLRLAHEAGITHRALTSDVVLVEVAASPEPVVWITRWESGDVASNQLSQRMDLTQMLALLAVRVGAARALQSAVAVLPADDVAAIGPLLQTPVLPGRTREEMRARPQVLAELRSALVELLPDAHVEPEQVVRFSGRTIVTILLTVTAVIVVLATVNVDEITAAFASSDWRWSVVAFALGLLTFVGAALAFVAFSPVRLPVWRATLVQAAGAFVALAAPAGIGPAALNLRMLTRRGVTASLSIATVALVQVSQFVVTIVLLLLLSVISGTSNAPRFTPSPALLLVVGVVAALLAASMLVPAVRQWVLRMTLPTVRQTWPRLIAVVGHPWRVALAIGGNVIMTMGYVLAFDACLAAFGQELSLVQVALIYLVGNAAGAAVPTPGGIGAIELALTTGLTAGGLNPGVAASVAVLFRVLTYWLRIPIGWVAMRVLQRAGDL